MKILRMGGGVEEPIAPEDADRRGVCPTTIYSCRTTRRCREKGRQSIRACNDAPTRRAFLLMGSPVMPAGLLAVAADFHIAPAAAAVAAVIEKQPAAIRSLAEAHSPQILGGQQLSGRLRRGPRDSLQRSPAIGPPLPSVSAVGRNQATMAQRLQRAIVNHVEIAGGDSLFLRDGQEHTIRRFAQGKCCSQSLARLGGVLLRIGAQLGSLPGGEHARLPGKGHQVGIALQVILAALRTPAPADGVGQIERELPAREIELKVR